MSEEHVNGAVVDLSAAMPMDTAELHIVVPGTSKPNGWVVTFAGPGHPKTVALSNENAREALQKEARIEQSQVNQKKYKAQADEVDERTRWNAHQIVARIVSWTPVRISQVSPDQIEFSEPAAMKLLTNPLMGEYFIQMVEFLKAEGSFIAASAKN